MKLSLTKMLAVGVMTVATTPAFAFNLLNTGNTDLIITVFDDVTGSSVVQSLGNYLGFLNNSTSKGGVAGTDVTPDAGYTQSWNVDLSVFGGNTSNLKWNIMAADGVGNYTNTELLLTAALDADVQGPNGDVTAIYGSSGYSNIAAQCTPNNGATSTLCTGTNFSNTYFGGEDWGYNMQFANFDTSAAIGGTLNFYSATRSSATAGDAAVFTKYTNSAGEAATFTLSSTGVLSYVSAPVAAVPVPAALWLLMSGIGGLGFIGRRRKAA